MNFLLHNRIEISNGKEKVYFYNSMLSSVFSQISLKKSYNDYIAIGQGNNKTYSESAFKLSQHLKTYKLDCEYLQDDILGEDLYIKKTAVIDDSFLDGKIIKEAGLTNSLASNPTIFNYFELKTNDGAVGISKLSNIPLVISVYVYLEISKSTNGIGLFTAGKNKFIDFLLGNGLNEEISCARGNLLINNSKSINRESNLSEKYPCEMDIENLNGELKITFTGDLGLGTTSEVLMLIGDTPFARISTISSENVTLKSSNVSVNTNGMLKIDSDVCEITAVKNNETNSIESEYITKHCAKSFGDKISLPFHNMFDNNTSRFLSKDGKIIFFMIDDKVYGYKNENYTLIELNTSAIDIQNIINIVIIDDFAFIISKNAPYIFAYKLSNLEYLSVEIDFGNYEDNEVLSNIFKCDLTYSKSNKLMVSVINKKKYYGYSFYFDYNQNQNKFVYDDFLCYEEKLNFVVSMTKTEFNDAMSIFLKSDELSYQCKIVYHYSNKTYNDLYSALSYYLTFDTKELYSYNRAVIVEKLTAPKIWIYLYPEIKKIELDITGEETDSYVSTNLKYIFQKFDDGSYKFYSLFDYENTTEFSNGLPSNISQNNVLDFVFLNDMVLVFLKNEPENIIALSLYENETYIENVSSNESTYNVSYSKFNLAGGDDKKVVAKFVIRMSL